MLTNVPPIGMAPGLIITNVTKIITYVKSKRANFVPDG